VLATSAILFAMARVYAPHGSLRQAFGVRRVTPVHLFLAAVAGAGMDPVLSRMDHWIAHRFPYDDPAIGEAMEKLVSHSSPAVLAVTGLVVLPLTEEIFFRGALFTQLARTAPRGVVILATALLFMGSREWRAMPTALSLGLLLGWFRAQSGSLLAVAVARLALSAVDGLPFLRGRGNPADDFVYPVPWVVAGAAAAGLAAIAMGFSGPKVVASSPAED
jgi:membrane protease YdiL (CAAX protease family)